MNPDRAPKGLGEDVAEAYHNRRRAALPTWAGAFRGRDAGLVGRYGWREVSVSVSRAVGLAAAFHGDPATILA
jgi:hypothetical protein